ncbi:uncharacterized protein METZ01_LOCUS78262, partial [marine metagenome]
LWDQVPLTLTSPYFFRVIVKWQKQNSIDHD